MMKTKFVVLDRIDRTEDMTVGTCGTFKKAEALIFKMHPEAESLYSCKDSDAYKREVVYSGKRWDHSYVIREVQMV
jgi:hypothetical protein